MPKQFTAQEIERLISRQKTYFMQGNTLSYEFRIRQLNKLKETIIKYEAELTQALQTDLGKSAFERDVVLLNSTEFDNWRPLVVHDEVCFLRTCTWRCSRQVAQGIRSQQCR